MHKWMVGVMAVLLFGLSAVVWLKPQSSYSDAERRALATLPKFSSDISEEFETYAQDQFPLRDTFRSIKAATAFYAFQKLDNNGLYMRDGHISRLEASLNENMLEHAADRFRSLYDTYLQDASIYFSIVPDKNYFLTEAGSLSYPSLDYEKLVSYMQEQTSYMTYIDIMPLLTIDDYYRTDSHWRQECIQDVAAHLSEQMGTKLTADYEVRTAAESWSGVYLGQLALPLEGDTLNYITNDVLEQCIATSYDTGTAEPDSLYNQEAIHDKDPYTFFPDDAVFVIENPNASTDKELILFRDSFGGSLAPYFCEAYSKVTLVDIRYVNPALLGQWIEWEGRDVLFLYSTIMLNNSSAFK